MRPAIIINDLVGHLLQTMEKNQVVAPSFAKEERPDRIWETIVFGILSSQVSIEKSRRAADRILATVSFFDPRSSLNELQVQMANELRHAAIRYRFPQSKARQITHSWFAFAQVHKEFHEFLSSFDGERAARVAVIDLFPGVGMKQASMLLRDIGFSRSLAILDTHIIWYFSMVTGQRIDIATPSRYLRVEDELIKQADSYNVEPNRLDTAIWAAVKALKAKPCMTQFA